MALTDIIYEEYLEEKYKVGKDYTELMTAYEKMESEIDEKVKKLSEWKSKNKNLTRDDTRSGGGSVTIEDVDFEKLTESQSLHIQRIFHIIEDYNSLSHETRYNKAKKVVKNSRKKLDLHRSDVDPIMMDKRLRKEYRKKKKHRYNIEKVLERSKDMYVVTELYQTYKNIIPQIKSSIKLHSITTEAKVSFDDITRMAPAEVSYYFWIVTLYSLILDIEFKLVNLYTRVANTEQ